MRKLDLNGADKAVTGFRKWIGLNFGFTPEIQEKQTPGRGAPTQLRPQARRADPYLQDF
jgi:hypothetical protein